MAQPCNLADIAAIGGTVEDPGVPDGQLTVDDLMVFFNLFGDGTGCSGNAPCNPADVTGIGGRPEPADGQLTIDDVIAYVNAFSDGCPPPLVTGDDGAQILFEHEFDESYTSGQAFFVLRGGGGQLFVADSDGHTRTIGAAALADPLPMDAPSFDLPPWVLSASRSAVAYEFTSDRARYYVSGVLITLDGAVEDLPDGVPVQLLVPLHARGSSEEATIDRLAQSAIPTPIDVINRDYNNLPPRPNLPALPGLIRYIRSNPARPVCPTNLGCLDACDCHFRQALWDAQMALQSSWNQCDASAAAGMVSCITVGGAFGLAGPVAAIAAYAACMTKVAADDISCRNAARDAYHLAYQVALSTRDGCILGCPGGGGGNEQ